MMSLSLLAGRTVYMLKLTTYWCSPSLDLGQAGQNVGPDIYASYGSKDGIVERFIFEKI